MKGRTLTVFTLALLTWAVGPAWAGGRCEKVSGTGQGGSPAPFAPVQGAATMTIGGETLDADFVVIVTGIKFTEDGSVVGTTRIVFDFGSGSTITLTAEHFALDPTDQPGVFRLNGVGKISEGTGRFQNAYGKLTFHGTMIFSPEGAVLDDTFSIKGSVCDITIQ
jgi:hypothetical protein